MKGLELPPIQAEIGSKTVMLQISTKVKLVLWFIQHNAFQGTKALARLSMCIT